MLTVGVAPGTTTLQLGNACPPDPPWQYFTPPFATGMQRPANAAGPSIQTVESYEPYGTESKLEGFGLTLPKANPQGLRWDIACIVGGSALLVALTLGVIASR